MSPSPEDCRAGPPSAVAGVSVAAQITVFYRRQRDGDANLDGFKPLRSSLRLLRYSYCTPEYLLQIICPPAATELINLGNPLAAVHRRRTITFRREGRAALSGQGRSVINRVELPRHADPVRVPPQSKAL